MIRGTTYKRKDGRWECRISLGSESGHKKYRSFYGKTKEEAEFKMVTACQSAEHSTEEITEMTVKELALEWFSAIKNRIKESTAANYRMKIEKHIIPVFGGMNIAILKAKTVYEFMEGKLHEGLSARYVSDIMVVLKSIFRYAAREYRINNVTDGIIMPKKSKPVITIMSKDEQKRLANYRKHRATGVQKEAYASQRIPHLKLFAGHTLSS